MAQIITLKPLGKILQDAGLVTPAQIQVALYDRQHYQDLRIGEILALRGWIEQETADFFVEQWFALINQRKEHRLGFYLKQAGLLTEKQIQLILKEQKAKNLRFGSTAVSNGLLKQQTLDFFLKNLFPFQAVNFSSSTIEKAQTKIEKPENYVTEDDINYWTRLSIQHLVA